MGQGGPLGSGMGKTAEEGQIIHIPPTFLALFALYKLSK